MILKTVVACSKGQRLFEIDVFKVDIIKFVISLNAEAKKKNSIVMRLQSDHLFKEKQSPKLFGNNQASNSVVYRPTTRLGCQNRKCTYVNNRCIRSMNNQDIIALTVDKLNECNHKKVDVELLYNLVKTWS